MRILVVEDEHKIANSIKKGLELEAYAVDVAYDGNDGYDLASTESYDVLVLDLMLPGMDGITICQRLREEGNHIPVLMLTARGDISDKVVGLNSGADDYLTKPFAFEELLARIKALSRRPRNTNNSLLKISDLVLNQITYEVKRNGEDIRLSRKEFALLEYLMRNSGRVIGKDQIIAHVWNYDSNILPNTVEVYVGYLRQKIDRSFPKLKPLIHTLRGFGYKIG